MPDAFRNSQADRPVVVKPPRTGADLNTMIQMAQGRKPTGKAIKYFKPEMIGLKSPSSNNPFAFITDGLNSIGSMIQMALGGAGATVTGNINAVEQARQKTIGGILGGIQGEVHSIEESRRNLVSGVEQARQQFNASIDKKRVAILPTIEIAAHPEKAVFKNTNITDSDRPDTGKNAVCNKRCEDYGGAEAAFCQANKWRAGCGHPGTNTDLASHDQDCSNFWGLGGLFDPLCTAGKGTVKAKDQYLIPVIIGGVIIIGIVMVMR